MPDQSVNYDYWYDDQDIKEALEICEKLPVGLKEPPTINQNDQYDIYVHIPYPIDYFSFTDNQILFLRDLLNYCLAT